MYALAFRLLNDQSDASDVVQEVFLKVFRNVGSFRGQSSLKTWMYRITVNEAHNARRWFFRHRQRELDLDTGSPESRDWKESIPDNGRSPYDETLDSERHVMIEAALDRINPSFRDAVVLRDVMDLSYEEIAEVLGVSLGTVKSRILRGREALREETRGQPHIQAGPATCAEDGRVKRGVMSCDRVQETASRLLDRQLPNGDREDVLAHLGKCRECAAHFESIENLRGELRSLAAPKMPPSSGKLRVLASHERARQLTRVSIPARVEHWMGRAQLWFDNLMRPVALPIAGGLVSALVLFSMLVPNLSFAHNFSDQSFFTHPVGLVVEQVGSVVKPMGSLFRIEPADGEIPSEGNVVLLTIDATGRVSDYSVAHGKLTPDLKNIIMFSQFLPATVLGLPTTGKVKVVQAIDRTGRA